VGINGVVGKGIPLAIGLYRVLRIGDWIIPGIEDWGLDYTGYYLDFSSRLDSFQRWPNHSQLFMHLDILFENEDLLVLNKPAGLVCHPTKAGPLSSLVSRVRLYLGGRAYLINRLDRETSGVTIAAKNAAAAGLLGKIWENRVVEKEYIAIVHGTVAFDFGVIDLPLGKDDQSQVAIKDRVRPDGAPAQTEFRVERRFFRDRSDFTRVRLKPRTGRKHQIRIHLAAMGHPVVGDKLYGGNEAYYLALVEDRLTAEDWGQLRLLNHALHASSVRFTWRGEIQTFSAPPDTVFQNWAAGQ
jgi:23S rRNA pseudouridine1911/1915/1917 synthase